MKVLLINTEHALLGGAHTVYLNTAEMLKKAGVEVVFFAMHSSKELPCEQSGFFAKANNRKNVFQYVKNSFYNSDAAKCLQRLLDAEHPDIAHVHLMWGNLSPSILDVLKKNHIPVVHTVHDYAMICARATLKANDGSVCEKCKGGGFCQSIKTRCLNGSLVKSVVATTEMSRRYKKHHPADFIDHFHFVSHFCADKHTEMDSRFTNVPQTVLYNVPDNLVVKMSDGVKNETYTNYYLYYGRLAYEKGIKTLIGAVGQMRSVHLKIVGTGSLEESLKDSCSNNGINNVEFLGFKKGEELYEIVQNAKFVCVPSEWYENNPMTIIEAYTLGTPVIAAKIGGIPEIVDDGKTGFLFESASVKSLVNSLKRSEELSREDYNQMKIAAKEFANFKFEREKYVERLLGIYSETINDYNR